jgi:hypothetical protein
LVAEPKAKNFLKGGASQRAKKFFTFRLKIIYLKPQLLKSSLQRTFLEKTGVEKVQQSITKPQLFRIPMKHFPPFYSQHSIFMK